MNMELSLHLDLPLGGPDQCLRAAAPCPPTPGRGHEPERRSLPLTVCLLLSLAVHGLLLFFRSAPPDTPPMTVMEISMAVMGGAHGFEAAGPAGPSDTAPAPGTGGTTPQTRPTPVPATLPTPSVQPQKPAQQRVRPVRAATPSATRRPKVHTTAHTQPAAEPPQATTRPQTTGPAAPPVSAGSALSDATDTPNGIHAGGTGAGPTGTRHGSGTGAGSGHGRTFAFGDADGPAFLHRVRPKYPPLSRARGEQGTVVVLLHIDAQGQLQQARVLTSAGPRLDQAALHAVQASTFKPASHQGRSFACIARLPIRFVLKS